MGRYGAARRRSCANDTGTGKVEGAHESYVHGDVRFCHLSELFGMRIMGERLFALCLSNLYRQRKPGLFMGVEKKPVSLRLETTLRCWAMFVLC